MKISAYLIIVMIAITFEGCEHDNYDRPSATLTGRFVYQNEQINVRKGIDVIRLYEPGWDKQTPINVNIQQDGTFSSLLFDGDYKLTLVAGNGPWKESADTLAIALKGSQFIDINIVPFFIIKNTAFSTEANTLKASFVLEQIVKDSTVESVVLFIGKTQLVDNLYNIASAAYLTTNADLFNHALTITKDLSSIDQKTFYARIGVKTVGYSEYVFSPVQKININ